MTLPQGYLEAGYSIGGGELRLVVDPAGFGWEGWATTEGEIYSHSAARRRFPHLAEQITE